MAASNKIAAAHVVFVLALLLVAYRKLLNQSFRLSSSFWDYYSYISVQEYYPCWWAVYDCTYVLGAEATVCMRHNNFYHGPCMSNKDCANSCVQHNLGVGGYCRGKIPFNKECMCTFECPWVKSHYIWRAQLVIYRGMGCRLACTPFWKCPSETLYIYAVERWK